MARLKRVKKTTEKEPIRRIKLDSFMKQGRLRTVEPDIADLWHVHEKSKKRIHKTKIEGILERVLLRIKEKSKVFLRSGISGNKIKVITSTFARIKKQLPYSIKKRYVVSLVAIFFLTVILAINKSSNTNQMSTLGVSSGTDSSDQGTKENKISREEISFKIMTPNGVSESNLKSTTRRSPSGDNIFTYQENRGDLQIEVTQQEMPKGFKGKEQQEIEKIAKEMQATNVIQINEAKIFHGLSEKLGVQSLITAKNNTLIFIRASQKQTDEFWTGYYLSLQ